MKVIRTERGWAGHFICAKDCLFRRNTLLEYEETKIVVSTVGNMLIDGEISEIGYERYFETMAFHAVFEYPYWDADVSREVGFDSNWSLGKDVNDNDVNDMHEAVVNEITEKLKKGYYGNT